MSSGYIGNAGDEAQQLAQDHVDNLIHEARMYFEGRVTTECIVCDEVIPAARINAMKDVGCVRCVSCQSAYDKIPKSRIRMLDHVL